MDARNARRQHPIARHDVKNSYLTEQRSQHNRRIAGQSAERDDPVERVTLRDRAERVEHRCAFGEPIETQGSPSAPQPIFLAGETRIILYNPAAGKTPKIDHFSVLVDAFDAANAVQTVKSLGANGAVLSRQNTFNEFFDPEGIRLQVTFPGQSYGATPAKK